MVTNDGYFIEQHVKHNLIAIHLPQTTETLTSTAETPRERRVQLSEAELATLLGIAKAMYEQKGE